MKRIARPLMAAAAFLAAGYVWATGDDWASGLFAVYLASIGFAIAVIDISDTHTEPDYVVTPDADLKTRTKPARRRSPAVPPEPRPKPSNP